MGNLRIFSLKKNSHGRTKTILIQACFTSGRTIIYFISPFREKNNVVIFPILFHIFMPLANLRLICLQGQFPILRTRSCSDLHPLICLLNNILNKKANWIGHILRRNCLLHDAIKGQMTEVKGVGRRRRTQLLDNLRNRRRYWKLKEEGQDRKRWRRQFINWT
jgi:hypothetical protein